MIALTADQSLLNGIGLILEALAILVTGSITFYSYRFYKFTKKINYLHFSLSFMVLSIASLSLFITNLLYFPSFANAVLGFLVAGEPSFEQLTLAMSLGTLSYRFLTLLGLLGIFWIIGRYHEKNKLLMLVYFVTLTSLISVLHSTVIPLYIFFHLTASLFLAYISYFYFRIYRRNGKKDTLYIATSFLLLIFSQLFFVLVPVSLVLQLTGYLMLSYVYYNLTKKK